MELRSGTARESGMNEAALNHVANLCAAWVDSDINQALCVLVARRGVVCLHEAFGVLGPEDSSPVERDTIFPLASLTKPVTATALMILVEEGLVGLTRPVQEYLPEFCGDSKDLVCVHHLLTHTSGLTDRVVTRHLRTRRQEAVPEPDATQHKFIHRVLHLSADVPLKHAPGELMAYTTHNFVLLGEIIRRVGGQSLAEFADSRVFEPLGMTSSSYVLPDEHFDRTMSWRLEPRAAAGVDATSTAVRKAPHADTGVHSTAMDLAIFGQMFLNGGSYGDARIVGRGTVSEMTRNQIPGIKALDSIGRRVEGSWGFGWCVAGFERWPGWPGFLPGAYSHSGAGVQLLWVDPVRELIGVYLTACRYKPDGIPINNFDLFVNAVTASVED